MNLKSALSLVVFAAAASSASVAVAGPYFGASFGTARTDVNCDGFTSCDRTGDSYRLHIGHRFGENWAIEGSYGRVGSASASAVSGTTPINVDVKASSLGIGAAYFLPFSESWVGVVRGGVAATRTQAGGSVGSSYVASITETKAIPYAGIGISYRLTPNFSIDGTFDYTQMKFGGETNGVPALRIGLSYSL
ncbi:hypothetical protein BH09PSE5_BH09PSE5_07050 [soil metagenome]